MKLREAEFNAPKFWDQIATIGPYEARTSKATQIHNPIFRYIHRAMVNTVFGRGDCARVRVGELFCLWSMLDNQTINTGFYLACKLQKDADVDSGDIVVGGFITTIAYSLNRGTDVENLEVVPGKMKIILEVCTIPIGRFINSFSHPFHGFVRQVFRSWLGMIMLKSLIYTVIVGRATHQPIHVSS